MPGEAVHKKRIVFLFSISSYMALHWKPLILAAVRAGHDVHAAVAFDQPLDPENWQGVTFHDLPASRGSPSPWRELRYGMAVWRLLRMLAPDLIHAVTVRQVIYGGLIARFLKVPQKIFSVVGLGYLFGDSRLASLIRPLGETGYRLALRQPETCTVFENSDDLKFFETRQLIAPGSGRVQFGGGVDLDIFSPSPRDKDLPFTVVMPARLLIEKGVHDFIAAARLIRRTSPEVRFALAGDIDTGNPTSLSSAEVDVLKAQGMVDILGWQPDMARTMRASAIVCLPSYREGAPRALMEAAAIGRAVVATDVAGCRDVVIDGVTGLLVPPRDPEALAGAIRTLIDDDRLRAAMGKAAVDHAAAHFDILRTTAAFLSLYDS